MAKAKLNEAQQAQEKWMLTKFNTVTGQIVQLTTFNENLITLFICDIIGLSKRASKDLAEHVLDQMTFGTKMKILKKLFKEKRPDLYTEHLKDLEMFEKFYMLRNRLCHSYVLVSKREIMKMDKKRIPYINNLVSGQTLYLNIHDYANQALKFLERHKLLVSKVSKRIRPKSRF